jgi:predicted cupin superfamily sugar epimerase
LDVVIQVFEIDDEGTVKHTVLGQDIAAGQKLMYVQRPNVWFGAYPTKDIERIWEGGKSMVKSAPRDPETHFSLVGCTVAPGFEFDDFELASRSDMLAKFPHAKDFVEFLTHAP